MAINFPEGTQNLPSRAVQVVSTTKRNVFTTTSTSLTDVPNLSVTITPKASSSKMLFLEAFVLVITMTALGWLLCVLPGEPTTIL